MDRNRLNTSIRQSIKHKAPDAYRMISSKQFEEITELLDIYYTGVDTKNSHK